jgi:hypothetical protein
VNTVLYLQVPQEAIDASISKDPASCTGYRRLVYNVPQLDLRFCQRDHEECGLADGVTVQFGEIHKSGPYYSYVTFDNVRVSRFERPELDCW